ncbi:carboxylate-amine ligase [Streptomyces cadmiisoli]|uniref:carboxylate-amine ligase n=1 Tax=Streptomyces cadmiisoli TaxID=2184053 RepID=UPI00365AB2DE
MSTASTGVTLGVEKEYVLLDAHSGLPVPSAARVQAAADLEAALGSGELDRELLQAQIEVATPICRDLAQVAVHLTRLRRAVRSAAVRGGCVAAASGAAPLASRTVMPVTPTQRYEDMHTEAARLVDEQLICGMHVHVAVPSRSLGAGALARLRPWLPVLVALGANSPFWDAKDTGFASWRTVVFGRWPASGAPPFALDAEQYEQRVEELLITGVIPDRHQLYWHARLSDTYPTLEVRAPDVRITVDYAVTLAGLIRGLVVTGLDETRDGLLPPNPPAGVLTAAGWHARNLRHARRPPQRQTRPRHTGRRSPVRPHRLRTTTARRPRTDRRRPPPNPGRRHGSRPTTHRRPRRPARTPEPDHRPIAVTDQGGKRAPIRRFMGEDVSPVPWREPQPSHPRSSFAALPGGGRLIDCV